MLTIFHCHIGQLCSFFLSDATVVSVETYFWQISAENEAACPQNAKHHVLGSFLLMPQETSIKTSFGADLKGQLYEHTIVFLCFENKQPHFSPNST